VLTSNPALPEGHPGVNGARYFTIQRVNGGANGRADGVGGGHRHTLEESDRVKRNSVQRFLLKEAKDKKKTSVGAFTLDLFLCKKAWQVGCHVCIAAGLFRCTGDNIFEIGVHRLDGSGNLVRPPNQAFPPMMLPRERGHRTHTSQLSKHIQPTMRHMISFHLLITKALKSFLTPSLAP
jgi:hypothetical protein